jgi:hypothetical protein
MPNWNENELTITGPDVNKVLETIRSQSGEDEDVRILDFNTIIPYPQMYRDMDKRAEEYREKLLPSQTMTRNANKNWKRSARNMVWNPARRGSRMASTQAVMSGAVRTGRRSGMPVMSISPRAPTLQASPQDIQVRLLPDGS